MKMPVLLAAATGAALMALSLSPAQAGMAAAPGAGAYLGQTGGGLVETVGRRGRHIGRGVAIGAGIVTLGVLGAIAANRARGDVYYDRHEYRRPYPRYRGMCHRWHRWCRNGDDRACSKFDTRC